MNVRCLNISIIKLIMASVVTFFISRGYTPENHSEILAIASPLATVAAMLFGFIIASVTMFSGSQNELIQNMKDTNKYEPFMSQLHITGLALITSCIFMVLAIFTPNKMLFEDLKISWDYSFLILGFLSLTYGLFEFWFCWKRVNIVSSKM